MILALLISPLIMAILPVKPPCTITIIARGAPLVLVVVVGHGRFYKIFGVWNSRHLIELFWKLIFRLLGWVPNRASSFWSFCFLGMDLLATLVISHIWLDRRTSSRATTIYTAADLEVNFIQIIVDRRINGHSVCLKKWRLVLRLLLYSSRFPLLWTGKIAVFTRIIFYKGLIGDELFLWYNIPVIHTKFIDRICNLLVLLNSPKTESEVRSILKDKFDVLFVLMIECPITLKDISIYQDCSSENWNVLTWITIEFEVLHVVKSLPQSIILIGEKCGHVGDKYIRSGCCQWHQFKYVLNNSIWQITPEVYFWAHQVLNHILICLLYFLENLYTEFHLVRGKSTLM